MDVIRGKFILLVLTPYLFLGYRGYTNFQYCQFDKCSLHTHGPHYFFFAFSSCTDPYQLSAALYSFKSSSASWKTNDAWPSVLSQMYLHNVEILYVVMTLCLYLPRWQLCASCIGLNSPQLFVCCSSHPPCWAKIQNNSSADIIIGRNDIL